MTPAQVHVLAALAASEVPSRTMLQKLVFFMARARDESLGFSAHLYGPFSADVQAAVSELVRARLVAEQALSIVDWSGTELEGVQYRYRLTSEGRKVADDLDHGLRSMADHVVKTAKQRHAFSPTGLSYAAKLAHLGDLAGHPVDAAEGPTLAQALGWKLTPNDIARASDFLAALKG